MQTQQPTECAAWHQPQAKAKICKGKWPRSVLAAAEGCCSVKHQCCCSFVCYRLVPSSTHTPVVMIAQVRAQAAAAAAAAAAEFSPSAAH
jgi:hypothetical protein